MRGGLSEIYIYIYIYIWALLGFIRAYSVCFVSRIKVF
jgi:hypothetical protein